MTLKQRNYNKIFWALQILGWGSFFLLVFFTLKPEGGIVEKIIFYISMCIVGILPTSVLRFYLKITNSVNRFSFFNVVKIIVGVALAAFVMIRIPNQLGRLSRFFMDVLLDNPEFDITNSINEENRGPSYLGSIFLTVVWTVVYLIIKYFVRINSIRADRLQLKESIKQAQLNTLRGHLNPEFIVAALNSIKVLMRKDVSESRSLLTRLSEILRYSLIKNNVNTVSLKEELELVGSYDALTDVMSKPNLDIDCKLDNESLNLEIPPMLLVNLSELVTSNTNVEITSKQNIELRIEKKENFLIVIGDYEDFNLDETNQLAIQKIKQRLKLLYKENASFIRNATNNGFRITINLPITLNNLVKDERKE
ncbi:sensor histidine kinase [uncultured Croceitalea sp.]|uniref:sensor histidine kinase n=1 Tax=uncultured Croceitalea sp. TaxID=1798908 RepID=UPI00374E434E